MFRLITMYGACGHFCFRAGSTAGKKDIPTADQILSHLDHMRQTCRNISCKLIFPVFNLISEYTPLALYILVTRKCIFANSEDPDVMPQNAAFHLGLHCLLRQK